jgi:HSP20 family molecular chaperone IbpA
MGALLNFDLPDFGSQFGLKKTPGGRLEFQTPFNPTPFTIESTGDDAYRLTLAVGDFGSDDITITTEGRLLIVSGRRLQKLTDDHIGLVPSGFDWQFQLRDHLLVVQATLVSGALTIHLVRGSMAPASRRYIPINECPDELDVPRPLHEASAISTAAA